MAVVNPATRYKRLPGRGRRLSGRFVSGETQRLYLGDDHILVVRQTGYEETSKRFFLGDIQAITVQSNSDRAVIGILLLIFSLLSAAIGMAVSGGDAGSPGGIFFYGIAGLLGVLLIIHFARGPSCTVRLHTAVQIEELTALRRFRVARKCLGILVPRIEAAQDGFPEGTGIAAAVQAGSAKASASAVRTSASKPPKPVGRGMHAAAFASTIAFGLSGVAEVLYQSVSKNVIDSILLAVMMLLLLMAAIRQVNSTLPKQTRELVWTTFALNATVFLVVMNVVTAFMAASRVESGEPPDLFAMNTPVLWAEHPTWLIVLTAIWGALNLLLGVFGLLSIRGYTLVQPGSSNDSGGAPS